VLVVAACGRRAYCVCVFVRVCRARTGQELAHGSVASEEEVERLRARRQAAEKVKRFRCLEPELG
jgi:hypothetical protein